MNTTYYNSLMQFLGQTKLIESKNDIIETLGYNEAHDGGAAKYLVVSNSEPLVDNPVFSGEYIYYRTHKIKLLLDNGVALVEQFGAKGNIDVSNLSDDDKAQLYQANSSAIESALNSGVKSIAFSAKKYLVSGGISVETPVNIIGNSATVELATANNSVISFDGPDSMLENVSVSDINIKGIIGSSNNPCTLLTAKNAYGFSVNNVKFSRANTALDIHKTDTAYEGCSGIRIINCIAENVDNGFTFSNVCNFKIQNCRIDMWENGNGIGLNLANNTGMGTVEDLSISEGYIGISYSDSLGWSGYAVERIMFKNLLVSSTTEAISIVDTDIPVHFANAMIVDSYSGLYMSSAKNITMTNSSVQLITPAEADEFSVPIYVYNYAQAKFTHTQFDFPLSFQRVDYNTDDKVTSDLVFVDCTLQKTDIAGAEGVTSPSGFGLIGVADADKIGVIETFDACEFKCYINTYVNKVIRNEEEIIVGYTFPVQLSVSNNSDSKLIIKNCRFVNENTCTVPYFQLDDSGKFDNIVVYNCFFENYDGTESSGSTFPIFGRLVNGSIETSNKDSANSNIHNIFAKCNMRSSKPDEERVNGTTINEMQEYI